ncbi:hypothetical protein [Nonomuraea sp. JJY05]|uniref:hypothetical protein n=1 Tax=Nonomuraea sp. JJY05 TaxID=3350255 RepID=UPI00373EB4C1
MSRGAAGAAAAPRDCRDTGRGRLSGGGFLREVPRMLFMEIVPVVGSTDTRDVVAPYLDPT